MTEDLDDDADLASPSPEAGCVVEVWRCLARVVERGIPYLGNTGALAG